MYNKLKQVYAVTSKKGIVPVYSAFRIYNGYATATDGAITRSIPIPELDGLDFIVPADKFIKAIQVVSNNCKIKVTDKNVLINDGKFNARIPLMQTEFPEVKPTGKMLDCTGLMTALSVVQPFIGTDASKRWTTGVLISGGYVYACNNVTIVRYKVDMDIPDMLIPAKAVNEVLKAGLADPIGTVYRNNAITFMFEDYSWLDTVLIDDTWPDTSRFFGGTNIPPIDPELRNAVELIAPFCNPDIPRVYFGPDGIRTDEGDTFSNYEGIALPVCCFHAEVLAMVLPRISRIDWSLYPKPCPFVGTDPKLEGVMIGLRI